jgi:NAD(P)H dehydrogenase (quinone)
MIVVTGASGQLGRLVIHQLLRTRPASSIVAAVRDPAKAADLAALGIQVREADYTQPETLRTAFAGARRILLISSSEVGTRASQHLAVIDAAKHAGVELLAYTSLLHADSSPLGLAHEHRATEAAIVASGLRYVMLRNGWYSENYAQAIPAALAHDALIGSAGAGRIASAARADYAAAAAAAISADDLENRIYELAGDDSYTLSEFATELSHQSGKSVSYVDMPETEYRAALLNAGLPEPIAAMLADSDRGAAQGGLDDKSRQLSALIGRPTTPMAATVAAALAA